MAETVAERLRHYSKSSDIAGILCDSLAAQPHDMATPPKTLAELLRLAIDDMQCLRREGVQINMDHWVSLGVYGARTRCQVCMAGAVLLRRHANKTRVGLIREGAMTPFELESSAWRDALCALDSLQDGAIDDAVCMYHPDPAVVAPEGLLARCAVEPRPDYEHDWDGFVRWLEHVHRALTDFKL